MIFSLFNLSKLLITIFYAEIGQEKMAKKIIFDDARVGTNNQSMIGFFFVNLYVIRKLFL